MARASRSSPYGLLERSVRFGNDFVGRLLQRCIEEVVGRRQAEAREHGCSVILVSNDRTSKLGRVVTGALERSVKSVVRKSRAHFKGELLQLRLAHIPQFVEPAGCSHTIVR